MNLNLHEIARLSGGRLVGGDPATVCAAVSTDSRAVGEGMLFVALVGERFDAHDFIEQVKAAGATAAVVAESRAEALRATGLPLIAVDDTRLALGRLAQGWRRRFRIPLVAITGSNGKTTTKEMVAAILRAQARLDGGRDDEVLATQGNLNNDIGLPLTLLGLRDRHRYAVVEMGMNHPGEIAYLASLAEPDAGLVVNALRAHLEGMGSLAGVAEEKGSLLAHLAADGVAVIAADSEFAALWRRQAGGRRRLEFSMRGAGDVNGAARLGALDMTLELMTPGGVVRARVRAPGAHNAHNATAAASLCLAAGCSLQAIERGLAEFAGVKGRLQQKSTAEGALLIDDTYNANPDSVRAAIDVLAAQPGQPRLLVLGDMGEIGADAPALHAEVGAFARERGIDALYCLGVESQNAAAAFGNGAHHFADPAALAHALRERLSADAAVLVKGSRFMRMERVVDLIQEKLNKEAQPCC